MNEDGLIKRALSKESFLGIDKFGTNRYFAKLNSDSEADLAKSVKSSLCDSWGYYIPSCILCSEEDEDFYFLDFPVPAEPCEQEGNAGALSGADVLERALHCDNVV